MDSSRGQMEIDNLSPVDGSYRSVGGDMYNRFTYDVEEEENICEEDDNENDNFQSNPYDQNANDSNAYLQKVQFQRIDKKSNQQAYFLFVIKYKEPDDEEQKINGYETSYTDLINLLREMQKQYPQHTPDFSHISSSPKKCIDDGNTIFDVLNVIIRKDLLFSSDLFQTFLEVNYKYNLNCQSQNTIYSSTTSIDNSPQGNSQRKIDEEEEEDPQSVGSEIKKNGANVNSNYHIDSPIEVTNKESRKKVNLSKSTSPTVRNKATSLHILQQYNSTSNTLINSNICINHSSNNIRRQKKKIKSSSGSEDIHDTYSASTGNGKNNNNQDQSTKEYKEEEHLTFDQVHQNYSNIIVSQYNNSETNLPAQDEVKDCIVGSKQSKSELDQGYDEEDGDNDEDEDEDLQDIQDGEEDEVEQDHQSDDIYEDGDYDYDDEDDDMYGREQFQEYEEEKTIANDDDKSPHDSSKKYERQKKETLDSNSGVGTSPNPSSSYSGNGSGIYEGYDQNYNSYMKRDSLKQYTFEDQRSDLYNQRSSLFQNGSVTNYSQFRPYRSSLMGLSQSSLQVLSHDQQSMQRLIYANSYTMIRRMNQQNMQNSNNSGRNSRLSNQEEQQSQQYPVNNTNLQNFESSISLSRSKRVIKISKDQIEARCHQQLLQAQTLGSISSTNSFDESPITKMSRRDKKLLINGNQHQKGVYSQLHIQQQQNHLTVPIHPQQLRQSQIIDKQRNSVQIQENVIEEISKTHKTSLQRMSGTQSQQGLANSLQIMQQSSMIKSKNPNTVSEVSICGNTVFEVDEDALSVKLANSDVVGDQTQNTITENNITEEMNDSSDSSPISKTYAGKQSFNKKAYLQQSTKTSRSQNQFYTHQDLDRLQKIKEQLGVGGFYQNNKFKKQISRTNPTIGDDDDNQEETKANHTIITQFDKILKISPEKKKAKFSTKNQESKEEEPNKDNVEEGQFQDHTELMFKSNNNYSSPERKQDQSSVRTRSIDSHNNSNNMSNVKVVEEYSAQYDFNSNEKVNVEDVSVGLVSGDLKKTDNKEKICNLLLNKQYSDLSEIGSGSYGLVLRARTPEGYIRALKIHCEKTEIEFKLAKFLSSEGTENLSANNIMTYNTIKFRDTISKRKIEVIEMELADDSLKNQIYGVKTDISDEKFRQICTQLVINVLSMHNMCVVHRDLKLDNILVSNGNYFLADFGISEEIGPQLIKRFIPGTDCFSIKQSIAGTQLYFSPIIRDAHSASPKKFVVDHDPFKSDIYTVGLILLEIELVRQKYSIKQIRQILSDKHAAYEYALKMNINKYLIKDNYYILKNRLYEPINILAELLQIEEINRISSVKLCLICQLDKIILSNIIVPHHKIFPPIIELKQDNTCVIRYTIKLLTYEGSYMKMEDGRILRHGEGSLYKLVEEESVIYKVLVYEGQWDNDLPHGLGTFYFFQNEWVYEGQFRNGQFFGEGVIKFIDWVVYKGTWYNFVLEDFLIPVDSNATDLFLQKENRDIEVVINTHDKEGFLRNIGLNEVELQFEINTFRLYAMNVIEFKQYLQEKQKVRVMLMSKKSKHDFHQSARQQLLLFAINKKKKRTFEVFIKYFKHEPILDGVILEQLIQLLNHSPLQQNSQSHQNSKDKIDQSNINISSNTPKYQNQAEDVELIQTVSDLSQNQIGNTVESNNNSYGNIEEDSDCIVYLNFDFFSKECASQFFERSSKNDPSLNVLKLEYLKNIGVPQQIEEETLIKLLLSKHVENLKELDLSCSKDVSSSIFVALDHKQNGESLKMLNLKYEALSPQTFCSLFKYPFLKQIQILDFSYSEFDDKCMAEFTQCLYLNSLQKLILCYCRNLTFKGLELFIQKISHEILPQLTHLDLEGLLSKGFQNTKTDKKSNKMLPSGTNANQNNENIHQTEQEMLLAFDRRHHLSSSNANLTTLHQPLIQLCNGTLNSGGSTESSNSQTIKSSSSISSQANLVKYNAYYHYFPYTSNDILKQLEYVQKENILRKNLIELNQITSSFSSSCNLPSMAQMANTDDLDHSNEQSMISENSIHSFAQIRTAHQLNQNSNPISYSPGNSSLTNFGFQNSSSNLNITSQINTVSSQQSIKNIGSNSNIQPKSQGTTFLNWVNKLTDKNLHTFEKFSKQNKIIHLSFLSLRATNIDDSVLKNLAKNSSFIHLKSLDISQCSQITNEGFESLIVSSILKKIIKIDISQTNISSITSKKPQQLFFQSLNLVDCNNISSQNICNFFSSKQNSSSIKHLYLDSDKFFNTQVNQVLLECQRLEDIHIYISQHKTEFIPNQLTLNLLIEKGYNLNFYSSRLFIQSVYELVKSEVIQVITIKAEQLNQIYINGINYTTLNRFAAKSGMEVNDTIKINRTQILDIPSKDISLEQLNDENIIEDLRKLFNSRNFLLVKELDISRLKVNSYAGQLLAGSRYTRSLAFIDLSYSTITDEDLNKLSKSKYLPQLQIIKLNCCKDITEKGINYLLNAQNNLENLKTIEVKQRLLNLYLLYPQCSERVQIIADQILFKAEQNQLRQHNNHHKIFQFAKYWTKIFRDNMQNINSIEISGFDENIIDYFLTHITNRNRVKKVIIDFSKKNQKMQTQIQNITQFQRINQIFSKLPDLKELRLDFSRWKDMTDLSIKEFSEGIVGLQNLKVLEINLSEWAKENPYITDLSCMFLGGIFQKIQKINVISVDLSYWGENNNAITDKSITYLSEGVHYTKDYLTYLSLNLNSWGSQMTNNSLIVLHYLVRDLNLLSFLNLGLQEWGKDNQNINDQGIESLTTAIGNSKYLNQLEINLAYAAHLNSGIGDGSVQNLAKSLMNINSLSSLKINLAWWMVDMNLYGFNTDVSHECIKDLAIAIGKLKSLTELDLNFDRWGYKNKFIKDESIINLADSIENLHALNSLSLNFDWWGLGNEKITDKSLSQLAIKVTQLNKLTSLRLFLSLDRWKKIEEKHIQQFKEKIMTLKNFNKNINIDIK